MASLRLNQVFWGGPPKANSTCMFISSDLTRVVTGDDAGICYLWSVERGTGIDASHHEEEEQHCRSPLRNGNYDVCLKPLSMLTGHEGPIVSVVEVRWEGAGSGPSAASLCTQGYIYVWNLMDGRCLSSLDQFVTMRPVRLIGLPATDFAWIGVVCASSAKDSDSNYGHSLHVHVVDLARPKSTLLTMPSPSSSVHSTQILSMPPLMLIPASDRARFHLAPPPPPPVTIVVVSAVAGADARSPSALSRPAAATSKTGTLWGDAKEEDAAPSEATALSTPPLSRGLLLATHVIWPPTHAASTTTTSTAAGSRPKLGSGRREELPATSLVVALPLESNLCGCTDPDHACSLVPVDSSASSTGIVLLVLPCVLLVIAPQCSRLIIPPIPHPSIANRKPGESPFVWEGGAVIAPARIVGMDSDLVARVYALPEEHASPLYAEQRAVLSALAALPPSATQADINSAVGSKFGWSFLPFKDKDAEIQPVSQATLVQSMKMPLSALKAPDSSKSYIKRPDIRPQVGSVSLPLMASSSPHFRPTELPFLPTALSTLTLHSPYHQTISSMASPLAPATTVTTPASPSPHGRSFHNDTENGETPLAPFGGHLGSCMAPEISMSADSPNKSFVNPSNPLGTLSPVPSAILVHIGDVMFTFSCDPAAEDSDCHQFGMVCASKLSRHWPRYMDAPTASLLISTNSGVYIARGTLSGAIIVTALSGRTSMRRKSIHEKSLRKERYSFEEPGRSHISFKFQAHRSAVTALVLSTSCDCNPELSSVDGGVAVDAMGGESYLVSGAADGTIRVWAYLGRVFVQEIIAHSAAVRALTVPPDSVRNLIGCDVVSIGDDSTVNLFAICPEKIELLLSLGGASEPVIGVHWVEESDHCYVVYSSGTVYVWSLGSGTLERVLSSQYAVGLTSHGSDSGALRSCSLRKRFPVGLGYCGDTVLCITNVHTDDSVPVLSVHVRRLINGIHKEASQAHESGEVDPNMERLTLSPTMSVILSHLLQYDDHEHVNKLRSMLSLQQRPDPPSAFALRGVGPTYSVLVPSIHKHAIYEISPVLSALRTISLVAVLYALVAFSSQLRGTCKQAMLYYTTGLPNICKNYSRPSFLWCAQFLRDPQRDIRFAARLIMNAILKLHTPSDMSALVKKLSKMMAEGSVHKTRGENSTLAFAVLICQTPDVVDAKTATSVVEALLELCFSTCDVQSAALRFFADEVAHCLPMIDNLRTVMRRFFEASVPPDGIVKKEEEQEGVEERPCDLAERALVNLGGVQPKIFGDMIVQVVDAAPNRIQQQLHVLSVISSIIRRHYPRIGSIVTRLIRSTLRLIDPRFGHLRDACYARSVDTLSAFVRFFPLVTFAKQRLAVAEWDGSITLFDLRTSSRQHIIETKMNLSAIALSPDAKSIASLALDTAMLAIYSSDHSMLQFLQSKRPSSTQQLSFLAPFAKVADTKVRVDHLSVQSM